VEVGAAHKPLNGVTPITLDSMSSGFNIGENISFDKGFNTLKDFTKVEVAGLLQPLTESCQLDAEKLMGDVTRWYNAATVSTRMPARPFITPIWCCIS
jgi:hypothetical protein